MGHGKGGFIAVMASSLQAWQLAPRVLHAPVQSCAPKVVLQGASDSPAQYPPIWAICMHGLNCAEHNLYATASLQKTSATLSWVHKGLGLKEKH